MSLSTAVGKHCVLNPEVREREAEQITENHEATVKQQGSTQLVFPLKSLDLTISENMSYENNLLRASSGNYKKTALP